jgi:hypothetical protein
VLAGALAQVTRRIRFFTSVYVAALRSPYLVAKAVGTAAVLSGDRVALGVGVGWCREEFELLEQDFRTRGRRTDEALELMGRLWQPGWTESEGPHYPTPRLAMEPTPARRVPIYVGGLSEVAFARAARHDGWIGDLYTIEEAGRHASRLAEIREQAGATGEFRVITALTDAFLPAQFAEAEAQGVTDVWTMPWESLLAPPMFMIWRAPRRRSQLRRSTNPIQPQVINLEILWRFPPRSWLSGRMGETRERSTLGAPMCLSSGAPHLQFRLRRCTIPHQRSTIVLVGRWQSRRHVCSSGHIKTIPWRLIRGLPMAMT